MFRPARPPSDHPAIAPMAAMLIVATAALTFAGIALERRVTARGAMTPAEDCPACASPVDFTATPAAPGHPGLLVTSVRGGGAADRAGLDVGDRIEAVDGQPVLSLGELARHLHAAQPRPMHLRVNHDGARETIVLAGRTD